MPSSILAQLVTDTDIPEVAWSGLMPLLIMAGGAVLLITVMSVFKDSLPDWFAAASTAAIGIGTIVAAIPLWVRVQDTADDGGPDVFATLNDAYGVDGFSIFLTMLFGAIVALVAMLGYDYLKREGLEGPEFYVLVMLSALGSAQRSAA